MCTAGTVVSPKVISGFERMRAHICFGFIGLTVVYALAYLALEDSSAYLPAAAEFCPTEVPCARPDLFAFQVSSGIAISYCGIVGFLVWNITRRVHTALPSTPEGRLFGYLAESEKLAATNFSFQAWDFVVSLSIPEHRTPLFLMHHFLAALVSYLSIKHQYLHYYGVFFLGVTEFSSVFLVLVDLGRYFPPVPGSPADLFVGIVCGAAFAVTFFWYRIVVWWKVSSLLWSDARHVLQKGTAEKLRPGKSYVLYLFLIANLPLGLLQLYWFSIVLSEAAKVVGIQ